LEEELTRELGAEVQLLAGSGGVYEISVDGREIFSKAKTGRFPQPREIISLIQSNLGSF